MINKVTILLCAIVVGLLTITFSGCDNGGGESYAEITPEIYTTMINDTAPMAGYASDLDDPDYLGATINPETGEYTYTDSSVSIVGTITETATELSVNATMTMTNLTDGETTLNGTYSISISESLSGGVWTMNYSENGSITITGGTISTVSMNTNKSMSENESTYETISQSISGYIEIDGTKYSAQSYFEYQETEDF